MAASLLTISEFVRSEPAIKTDQSAYQMARAGLLPIVRIGRKIFVDPAAWEEFKRAGGRALAFGWRRAAPGA